MYEGERKDVKRSLLCCKFSDGLRSRIRCRYGPLFTEITREGSRTACLHNLMLRNDENIGRLHPFGVMQASVDIVSNRSDLETWIFASSGLYAVHSALDTVDSG